MANTATSIRLSGLARRLVSDGLLNEENAQTAQSAAKESKQAFVSYLVNNKILASGDLAAVAAQSSVYRYLISMLWIWS